MTARRFFGLGGKQGARGEEVIGEMESHLVDGLHREGVAEEVACRIVGRAMDRMISDYGGARMYIPRVNNKKVRERNQAIIAAFDGANLEELGRKFGLTGERIRQIIRAEDEQRKARRAALEYYEVS